MGSLRRKNLIESIKAPIFLEAILAIDIMLRPQSNLEEKENPSILKNRPIVLKNRPIHFHMNSTSVIRPVKRNKFSFSRIEISRIVSQVRFKFQIQGQTQVQKPDIVVATNQMPDHKRR